MAIRAGDEESAAFSALVESSSFQKAPALRRLFQYLWDHRSDPPSEYAIALDVFGKKPDFEPKVDAAVRVNISRLRLKLREFYEKEGQRQTLRFEVPPGSLRLDVRPVDAPARAEPPPDHAPTANRWIAVLASAIVLLLLLAGLLLVRMRSLEKQLATSARPSGIPSFWSRAVANGKVTRVVFPIPLFFQFDKLRVRDVGLNDASGMDQSPLLKDLLARFGAPSRSDSYSVTSDTLALVTLTRFLTTHNIPFTVAPTRDLSPDTFGSDNLLFLGVPPTNSLLERFQARTNFQMLPGATVLGNRNPAPSESAEYRSHRDEFGRQYRYGVLAVLPGHLPGTSLILMNGLHSASVASFSASPDGLKEIDRLLAQNGSPTFFEVVVQSEVDGHHVRGARAVAFRTASASLWK